MKKLIALLLLTVTFVSLCACASSAEYKRLKAQYPDSEIRMNGRYYDVISENVDYSGLTASGSDSGANRDPYKSLDDFWHRANPAYTVIFLGHKTGESKQIIPKIDENNMVNGLPHTESIVEVTAPYFGLVKKGQQIILSEYFVVYTDENGVKTLDAATDPIPEGEFIFVLRGGSRDADLYDGKIYACSPSTVFDPDLEEQYKYSGNTEISGISAVIEKYYRNHDRRIDKKELAYNVVAERAKIESIAPALSDEEKAACMEAKRVINLTDPTYEDLCEGLTPAEVDAIEQMARQYGEK